MAFAAFLLAGFAIARPSAAQCVGSENSPWRFEGTFFEGDLARFSREGCISMSDAARLWVGHETELRWWDIGRVETCSLLQSDRSVLFWSGLPSFVGGDEFECALHSRGIELVWLTGCFETPEDSGVLAASAYLVQEELTPKFGAGWLRDLAAECRSGKHVGKKKIVGQGA
jgi:hypothetical protein